uniref:Cytochrome b561 domain-containing protein n=1 Tax=Alexandrium catenella TaxID=2925 RepID=A0A7S1RRX4_ALECA|mmetsp:Transcript_70278/g.186774  ORF Transcript_70278/g.186774 Transcript_70278/m.186774 type:complete len:225 (+) Transcript_70278:46-720(+)
MTAMALNLTVATVSLSCVVLTAVAMFAPLMGGGMDPKVWFGWHPVLMTLAFPCLMTLGRWSYLTGDSRPLTSQRALHGILMGLGSLAMLLGYLAIFEAHLPQSKFFAYDFKAGAWSPDWKRVVHVYLGYALIVAVLAQAFMGARKLQVLGTGQRVLTFHGSLGKAVILLACFNIIIAIRFWGWSTPMKVCLYALTIAAGVFGALWPRPSKASEGEDASLFAGPA